MNWSPHLLKFSAAQHVSSSAADGSTGRRCGRSDKHLFDYKPISPAKLPPIFTNFAGNTPPILSEGWAVACNDLLGTAWLTSMVALQNQPQLNVFNLREIATPKGKPTPDFGTKQKRNLH